MRLGVLDIGSNTGHLLVVDAHDGAAPLPAFSFKQPLRLGVLAQTMFHHTKSVERVRCREAIANLLTQHQSLVEKPFRFCVRAARICRCA